MSQLCVWGQARQLLKLVLLLQDQIFEMPPGGTLLASSAKTPIEIWALGNQVLCIQGTLEAPDSSSYTCKPAMLMCFFLLYGPPEVLLEPTGLKFQCKPHVIWAA